MCAWPVFCSSGRRGFVFGANTIRFHPPNGVDKVVAEYLLPALDLAAAGFHYGPEIHAASLDWDLDGPPDPDRFAWDGAKLVAAGGESRAAHPARDKLFDYSSPSLSVFYGQLFSVLAEALLFFAHGLVG
jgi:hypothetical protein